MRRWRGVNGCEVESKKPEVSEMTQVKWGTDGVFAFEAGRSKQLPVVPVVSCAL